MPYYALYYFRRWVGGGWQSDGICGTDAAGGGWQSDGTCVGQMRWVGAGRVTVPVWDRCGGWGLAE